MSVRHVARRGGIFVVLSMCLALGVGSVTSAAPPRSVRVAAPVMESVDAHTVAAKHFVCGPKCVAYAHQVYLTQLRAFYEVVWLVSLQADSSTLETRNCVKSYESGNYAESTHPQAGSGAFQFIPSTWRTYYARWSDFTGYGRWAAAKGLPFDYAYAFLAPAWIQDAVIDYALRNGGAGNWSMNYGVDPCTGN